MEVLFGIDGNAHYTLAEAFAYARLQPPTRTFHLPYAVGPIAFGAMLGGLIMYIPLRLLQRHLIRAELSIPKGRAYFLIALMMVLAVVWAAFWVVNPWSNATPFLAFMNLGVLGLFVGAALLILISLPFSDWKVTTFDPNDFETIKEEIAAEHALRNTEE